MNEKDKYRSENMPEIKNSSSSNLPFKFYQFEGQFVARNQFNRYAYKYNNNHWELFDFPLELEREFAQPISLEQLNTANAQAIETLKSEIASPENLQILEIRNDLNLLLYPDYLEREFSKLINKFSVEEQQLLKKTLDFIKLKHRGQFREENTSYTTHLIHAAIYSLRHGGSSKDTLVMLLHDVVEDTSTTTEELENIYGKEIAQSVISLSKQRNNIKVPLEDYYRDIDADPQLVAYKAFDRLSNIVSMYLAPSWPKRDNYLLDTKNKLIPLIEKHHPELAEELKRSVKFVEENPDISSQEKRRIEELAKIRDLTSSIKLK